MPAPEPARILVVDDHAEMAALLAEQLTDHGYSVETAAGGAEALERFGARPADVVITDLRMEDVDGFDVLDGVLRLRPGTPVLIMTAFGAIDSAVDAIKRGAFHYLTKPFRLQEVLVFVERALEADRLRQENHRLRQAARSGGGLGSLIGESPAMHALYTLIERVAESAAPVLVRGESGSGKELVARAIHDLGPRRQHRFVAVNCTSIPAELLESELFGHARGAFTGASAPRRGLFVEADAGTLFLDEIGDMPAPLQAKLLRVLEDGEVRAVGSDASRQVDVRLIAATHQPLEQRVASGALRQDLFYRLNVLPVAVPALRERLEDIPRLTEHFLWRARESTPNATVTAVAAEAQALLAAHDWPGNVRELENVIRRLVVMCPATTVEVEELRRYVPALERPGVAVEPSHTELRPLREVEEQYIEWVLRSCGGNRTQAAKILGVDVSTLYRRTRKKGP